MVDKLLELLKSKGKPPLATIDFDDAVQSAVEKMIRNDFSQIPVVKEDKIVGVVTFSSIVRSLFHTGSQARGKKTINILKCQVGDIAESVSTRNHDEDLFDLLNALARESFVLVKTKDNKIEIITNYDVITYFRELAEPFLFLNDIEDCLKQMIRARFDKSSFIERAEKVFKYKNHQKAPPTELDELSLSDYIVFISSNWRQFGARFGIKSVFDAYLEKTRKIRNRICHFRGVVDRLDKEFIKFVLDWLRLHISNE